tara:strand:- start:2302 stop:4566 length:2265 start_codon:yes stop_codon:yes gene_type:complete
MKLTDNEKRDVVKLIEEGKVLPEKYRFLLFDESKQVELTWNGKSDEVTNIVLPFQVIEQVDEPRSENVKMSQGSFDFASGRQITGWANKLIWGDNKYILSSLKNGPLRKEIEQEGGIKLIYIDPPFDVGADFSMNIDVGEGSYEKKPNVLEHIAYRDTWGLGADSFLSMIYERLILMHNLLSEDGLIFLHCDYRLNSSIRLIMDEIFGKDNFRNEIYIKRKTKNIQSQFDKVNSLNIALDSLLFYSKNKDKKINVPRKRIETDNKGKWNNFWNNADRPTMRYELLGIKLDSGQWRWREESAKEAVNNYKNFLNQKEYQNLEDYWEANGKSLRFIRRPENSTRCYYWIPPTNTTTVDTDWSDFYGYDNKNTYPTAKSNSLLERIILNYSEEGDLISDFFAGSGVLADVAEKNNRKWICSDLGKFSIHSIRKRMIGIQRELKKQEKKWRAFEILNLGKYQRQHFIYDGKREREEVKEKNRLKKEKDFENLILDAYKAEEAFGFGTIHGRKGADFVSIGPINQPLSRNHVEEVISECLKNNITSVDILGFEYEMGLFPTIQEEAKSKGLRLSYKQIPTEVFDKRAVSKGEVVFHDVAYIEFKPHFNGRKLSVELTDFAVFYNENNLNIDESLGNGKSSIIVENGQIVEKKKDKDGIISETVLTKNWYDWIDYWSVDFDYESKPEIIKFKTEDGKVEEEWTGNYVFENEWQSFREKKGEDKLELKSSEREIVSGKTKVAVKVVDIFGNDTMKVLEVKV